MTSVNPGTGNPNAKQLVSRPEAGAGNQRIAPAPPGQVSYMSNRCGAIRKDGSICRNYPQPGRDRCLGHSRSPNAEA